METPHFLEEENPFFSIKRVFSLPNPLSFQKNDQRASRPLDSGKWVGSGFFEFWALVIGLDVRHDLQRAVCSLRDWLRIENILVQ